VGDGKEVSGLEGKKNGAEEGTGGGEGGEEGKGLREK